MGGLDEAALRHVTPSCLSGAELIGGQPEILSCFEGKTKSYFFHIDAIAKLMFVGGGNRPQRTTYAVGYGPGVGI